MDGVRYEMFGWLDQYLLIQGIHVIGGTGRKKSVCLRGLNSVCKRDVLEERCVNKVSYFV